MHQHSPEPIHTAESESHIQHDLLAAHQFSDCSPVSTPMEPGYILEQDEKLLSPEWAKKYISAVGSLLYLAIATRPDIAFAVGALTRFNSKPGESHWKAIKHLFRYLQGEVCSFTIPVYFVALSQRLICLHKRADYRPGVCGKVPFDTTFTITSPGVLQPPRAA